MLRQKHQYLPGLTDVPGQGVHKTCHPEGMLSKGEDEVLETLSAQAPHPRTLLKSMSIIQ